MTETGSEVLFVCIEYAPATRRVMVRGTFIDRTHAPPPLAPENRQNLVGTFLNMDMGPGVGFAGLVAEDLPL